MSKIEFPYNHLRKLGFDKLKPYIPPKQEINMLEVLKRAEYWVYVNLVDTCNDELMLSWNSLNVDYEPPKVERLWVPFEDDYRVYLHKIYPCDKALMHPHPWPSAVKIVSGKYEMEIGSGGPSLTKTILTAGSSYEMKEPIAHHSVKPIDDPSYSIMVTGKPFEKQLFNHDNFGKNQDLKPLDDSIKLELIKEWRRLI